jgi:hypothetical protein
VLAEKCWRKKARIKATCHNFFSRSSDKGREKTLGTSGRWLAAAKFVDWAPRGELKDFISLPLQGRRPCDSGWRERGTAPAGKGSSLLHPSGFGHQPSGITTGVGVETLDWDRRARVTPVERCRDLRRKAVHKIVPFPPSRRKHGLELSQKVTTVWREPLSGTPTGERALQGARCASAVQRLVNSVCRRSASFWCRGRDFCCRKRVEKFFGATCAALRSRLTRLSTAGAI